MGDLFTRLRLHWQKEAAGVAAATATPSEISAWERRYQVLLPDDLRAYVTQLNGTFNAEVFEFGNDMISFFPLKAMVAEHEFCDRHNDPNMFVFADYLISSQWWCAEITETRREHTRIYVRSTSLTLIAESLEEFLEAYMSGSQRIYLS